MVLRTVCIAAVRHLTGVLLSDMVSIITVKPSLSYIRLLALYL